MSTDAQLNRGLEFYPALQSYLAIRELDFDNIPAARRTELEKVADFVRDKLNNGNQARLTFICTHNSRRSHLSQIWAQVAASYYQLNGVETYSGGTEETAFNPRAVAAMRRCGLDIKATGAESNPHYEVRTSDSAEPMICFSKKYDAPPNPSKGYCAVMTCSQADNACPLVVGCELRMPIRYDDPKVADDTDAEAATYDLRCAQICTEMLYLMSKV